MNEENVCEKVRFAISVGDERDIEMMSHLEVCEKCRTFLEQSEKMTAELNGLSFDSFTKDGKSVADSVMEEIKRQKMFTSGNKVQKYNGYFRHMGLIAACVVIFVMALPVMNSIFGAEKNSEAIQYENRSYTVCEDQVILNHSDNGSIMLAKVTADAAEGEEYPEDFEAETVENEADSPNSGNVMFMARPKFSDTDNSSPEIEAEAVEDAQIYDVVEYSSEVDEYNFYEGFAVTSKNDSVNAVMPEEKSSDVSKPQNTDAKLMSGSSGWTANNRYSYFEDGYEEDAPLAFESIEDAAIHGAVMYCDSEDVIVVDSLEITYTDSESAYAVFAVEDGGDITVYLKREDGMWIVFDVCDGDITE